MFERPSRDDGSPPAGAIPRVRLEQLAAQAARAARASEATERAAPPADDTPPPGRAGRLVERWVPEALAEGVGRRRWGVAAVVLLAGVVVAVTTVLLLGGRPAPEHAPPLPSARNTVPTSPTVPTTPKGQGESLVVSVVGKVQAPGLVTVPAGARVADAVRAAGGAAADADLSALNLARRLTDGEQLYVGIPPPPGAQQGAPAGTVPGAPPAKISLNTAGVEQLDTLPGVGEVTAKRIVDWRTQHGGFTSVEQLREIEGIGETRFSRLRDLVTVS